MAVSADTMTDLYGFEIKVNVQQQAVRLQCDGAAQRHEGTWSPFIQSNKLPPEAKLKLMVRKVRYCQAPTVKLTCVELVQHVRTTPIAQQECMTAEVLTPRCTVSSCVKICLPGCLP